MRHWTPLRSPKRREHDAVSTNAVSVGTCAMGCVVIFFFSLFSSSLFFFPPSIQLKFPQDDSDKDMKTIFKQTRNWSSERPFHPKKQGKFNCDWIARISEDPVAQNPSRSSLLFPCQRIGISSDPSEMKLKNLELKIVVCVYEKRSSCRETQLFCRRKRGKVLAAIKLRKEDLFIYEEMMMMSSRIEKCRERTKIRGWNLR